MSLYRKIKKIFLYSLFALHIFFINDIFKEKLIEIDKNSIIFEFLDINIDNLIYQFKLSTILGFLYWNCFFNVKHDYDLYKNHISELSLIINSKKDAYYIIFSIIFIMFFSPLSLLISLFNFEKNIALINGLICGSCYYFMNLIVDPFLLNLL